MTRREIRRYVLHVFSSADSLLLPELLLKHSPLVELALLLRPHASFHVFMLPDDLSLQLLYVFQLQSRGFMFLIVYGQQLMLLELEFVPDVHDDFPLGEVDGAHVGV